MPPFFGSARSFILILFLIFLKAIGFVRIRVVRYFVPRPVTVRFRFALFRIFLQNNRLTRSKADPPRPFCVRSYRVGCLANDNRVLWETDGSKRPTRTTSIAHTNEGGRFRATFLVYQRAKHLIRFCRGL